MSEQDLFEEFVNSLQFNVSDYLDTELSDSQNKLIDDATFILQDNIVGDIKKFGGSLLKNKEKFDNFIKKAETELQKEDYKDHIKELKNLFKDYIKKLQEFIAKTVIAVIPVKELPWIDVVFRSVPRIVTDNKKVELLDNAIAYYGEIKCLISRTCLSQIHLIVSHVKLFTGRKAAYMHETQISYGNIMNKTLQYDNAVFHNTFVWAFMITYCLL